ncbi:unnamed protein product [Didymodactylos carnosus]|uniref:Uncharacterized protein n=1 Tax=Didymodactylos carnosus TaxID=1234261 RepID=A0A8S2CQ78_9BILA|nr:unnamed protein product [Didymodactylos carnosus]CAF3492131.1 unnamed protein product [Didymodactylos carnosus]
MLAFSTISTSVAVAGAVALVACVRIGADEIKSILTQTTNNIVFNEYTYKDFVTNSLKTTDAQEEIVREQANDIIIKFFETHPLDSIKKRYEDARDGPGGAQKALDDAKQQAKDKHRYQ